MSTEETYLIEVQELPEVTKEDCMERGICYACAPTFEIPLVHGLCSYCDEDKYMRNKLRIPDDACWWENRYHGLVCGTDSMCPCRSYFEMELFKKREWELSSWPGGTCSQALRDQPKADMQRQMNTVGHSIVKGWKESTVLSYFSNNEWALHMNTVRPMGIVKEWSTHTVNPFLSSNINIKTI